MGKNLTLVLGGARSGKSTYAEKIAMERGAAVLYLATAQAWDAEMAERIANHRADRPTAWQTVEAPTQVGAALDKALHERPGVDLILLDCLTLLASNVLIALPETSSEAEATAALMAEVDVLLQVYEHYTGELIIVSNEVGLGIVPTYPLGRLYRDALGRANQRLAAVADKVIFMVAGLPMVIK